MKFEKMKVILSKFIKRDNLTPLGSDLGYAGEKLEIGGDWSLRKLGELPRPQAAQAPVRWLFVLIKKRI
jgi:hypothetical protein